MSRKTCYALDSQDDMLVVLRFLRGVKLACDRAVAQSCPTPPCIDMSLARLCAAAVALRARFLLCTPTMSPNISGQSTLGYLLSTLQTIPPLLLSLLCLC